MSRMLQTCTQSCQSLEVLHLGLNTRWHGVSRVPYVLVGPNVLKVEDELVGEVGRSGFDEELIRNFCFSFP